MLAIPTIDKVSVVFGDIKHMPRFSTLPEKFQNDWHYEPHCKAVGKWFYSGAKPIKDGIQLGDEVYKAKPGVDAPKALAAIRAVLGSFEPKHEHKMAACGYMLSE